MQLCALILFLLTSVAELREPEPALPPAVAAIAVASPTDIEPETLEFLTEWDELLAMLPLEDLEESSVSAGRLCLRFDFGEAPHREVELSMPEQIVLKKRRGSYDLRDGRTKRLRPETRTVRVKREVLFSFDLGIGVTGVRQGDLSIHAFFARRSLDVRTWRSEPGLAVTEDGELLLATEPNGAPLRIDGQYVPKAHTRWLEITCCGRSMGCGVGPYINGRTLL